MPPRLEEITYDMSRTALADQESLVAGLRSRTATLVAVQALVVSFLGRTAIERGPLGIAGWVALGVFVLGLVLAAIVMAPWRLMFALDARRMYDDLRAQAEEEAAAGTLAWLVAAAQLHYDLRRENRRVVRQLVDASAALGVMTIVQSLLWIVEMGVR